MESEIQRIIRDQGLRYDQAYRLVKQIAAIRKIQKDNQRAALIELANRPRPSR